MYVAHYDDQSVFFFIRKQLIMPSVSPFFKDLQLSLAQWWIFLKKNTKNNVRKVLFFVTYLLDWKMKVGLSSPLTFILEKYWCANVYSIWLPSKPQYGDYCTVSENVTGCQESVPCSIKLQLYHLSILRVHFQPIFLQLNLLAYFLSIYISHWSSKEKLLNVPRTNLKVFRWAYAALAVWNILSFQLRHAPPLSSSKQQMKMHCSITLMTENLWMILSLVV